MHSADYVVASLSHAASLSKRLNVSSNFFYHRVATPNSIEYSDGDPLTGATIALLSQRGRAMLRICQ